MKARHVSLAIVVAFASSACQLVLGIDADVATSNDASTSDDAGVEDGGELETSADAAAHPTMNFNVYLYGHNAWQEERDSGASVDDADDAGAPLTKPYDIKVTLTQEHGAWIVLAASPFDTSPYGTLNFNLKPTVASQTWTCYLLAPDGSAMPALDVTTHGNGMPLTVGEWGSYKLYLSELLTGGTTISGIVIQDTTSLPTNVWYVDDVGFVL